MLQGFPENLTSPPVYMRLNISRELYAPGVLQVIIMKEYESPRAEKLEFNYNENVVASDENTYHHGDMGHGFGGGGGCDHNPGHGNPKKPHP